MSGKVCIIGGGPWGIGIGKELGQAGIAYDIYEAESDFGGVWNYRAKSGRVYSSAHIISSKSFTEFSDFPMPDDYPHYPGHTLMLRYVRSFARQFGVYEHAQFNTSVEAVEREDGGWAVTLSSGDRRHYEYVCVCNGLQREPIFPKDLDASRFAGELFHSIEYKSPEQLRNKRVLVVGAGNTGCDLVVDAVHHGSAVYHSTRRGYYYQPKFIAGKPTPEWMLEQGNRFSTTQETMAYFKQVFKMAGFDGTDYGLPKPDHEIDECHPIMNTQLLHHIGQGDIIPKCDLKRLEGDTAYFKDGSSVEVDVVILATGYQRSFPFFRPGFIEYKNGIPDLFLHIAHRQYDNILFQGYINAAAGLGSLVKLCGLLTADYITARDRNRAGYREFNRLKLADQPDMGDKKFIDSFRHAWEVDFWKYLNCLNHYRAVINQV